jgi:hypothetical protein
MSQCLDGQIIAREHIPVRGPGMTPLGTAVARVDVGGCTKRLCSRHDKRCYKKRWNDEVGTTASINGYKEEGPENYEDEISVAEHASTDNSEDEDSED